MIPYYTSSEAPTATAPPSRNRIVTHPDELLD